jgi:flavin reductase (DIM6/NTAB) family NADH-FMN oxidoreductase RutF
MIIEAATFRQVLGNYPTGVAAITAMTADGVPVGMVVGTFTSVSLDPPLVGFLPDKKSDRGSRAFCRQRAGQRPDRTVPPVGGQGG